MEGSAGLLKIKVKRGINLVVRDAASSDPYVAINMGSQRVKTCVVNNNCNPEWNDDCSLCIRDVNTPIVLTVHDKDTFTVDDKMGDAEIDIKPYLECLRMGLEGLPDGTTVGRVQPSRTNCLAEESCIVLQKDGRMYQDMVLRLRNVPSGEVEIQIEWVDLPKHI